MAFRYSRSFLPLRAGGYYTTYYILLPSMYYLVCSSIPTPVLHPFLVPGTFSSLLKQARGMKEGHRVGERGRVCCFPAQHIGQTVVGPFFKSFLSEPFKRSKLRTILPMELKSFFGNLAFNPFRQRRTF